MIKIENLFWAGVDLLTLALFSASLAGFLGNWWWIFDLLGHFRVQYLIVFIILMLIYGLGVRRIISAVAAGFVLLNLVLVLPLYVRPRPAHAAGTEQRILLANVLTQNRDRQRLSAWIDETSPDYIALLEVDETWLDDLDLTARGYPYAVTQPRGDNFGVALYSRLPLENSEITNFGSYGVPSIISRLKVGETPLTFIVTHPIPPKRARFHHLRNAHMDEIARYASRLDGAVILVGDLNATSWSPFFRDWLAVGDLRDSRRGFGVQPTWPVDRPLLRIPIDHALVSPGFLVHHRQVGPDIGSDHLPILLDFSLPVQNAYR
jgi:endonuclease/exonuclease/phosphatase (EEP) superfamily protein YafD